MEMDTAGSARGPIRVVIVDDYPLVRDALVRAASLDPEIRIAAACPCGPAALETIAELAPDVVVVELRVGDEGGVDLLRQLTRERRQHPIMVLTACDDPHLFLSAMERDVAGYVTLHAETGEIVQAIHDVGRGRTAIDPTLAAQVVREVSTNGADAIEVPSRLSTDEREILRLVAMGQTDREISTQLYVSPRTVQNYLSRIRRKTGIQRRPQLAKWASEHTWV